MKKILAALIVLLLVSATAFAYPSEAFLTAVSNASFLITETNSSGIGMHSDGIYDIPESNTIAVSYILENFTYAQFREIKKLDAELYASLAESFESLSQEFYSVCNGDLYETFHVVFAVMSNDGVGLYLTIDSIDMTWMIADY